MKYCLNCGQELPDGARFCAACGVKQPGEKEDVEFVWRFIRENCKDAKIRGNA